ncbi:Ankyrin repeat-containing domain [Pseudocohnilembus persalinus]|uniref:Ankyrin repeat-containing domain n=1 Tax=Pseudocohnilembus persalinus TaxID=266149 RepID=A0A0V0Q9Y9_PSEPJ|nr:Ankyrin repeat-containing domain [Pseudocohnilembus persalinus]|eukprot:KRW98992.1 Ankyrin repeat-containing domain [Pseudocohnilembus persalinus]
MENIQILEKFEVDWELLDSENQTPIFLAVLGQNLDALKFLVNNKRQPLNHEFTDHQNRSPFFLACYIGNLDIVKYLYSLGVDVNRQSGLGRSALLKACYLGNVEVTKFLVNLPEIDIELPDQKQRTALHNSVFISQMQIKKQALPVRGIPKQKEIEKGLPDKEFYTYWKQKTLQEEYTGVKIRDSPQCSKLLLEKGHRTEIQDQEGNTPIFSACSSGAMDSLQILLQYKANVNHVNFQKQTPVYLAAYYGRLSMVYKV